MPKPQQSATRYLTASGNLTVILLALLDLAGVVLIFNLWHWQLTDVFASNLLLTWKLALIASFTFLYYYLIDLYTFDSPLSQMGMLERSFIAMLLIGITTAVAVYIVGPSFIGGFVGRGVMATSLIFCWLWSLAIRYLLNIWMRKQRKQVAWVVLQEGDIGAFISHFRSLFQHEQLLILSRGNNQSDIEDSHTRVLGNWDHLNEVIQQEVISGIIVTTDKLPDEMIDQLMAIRIRGVRIYSLNDFYEKFLARLPVLNLDDNWLVLAHGFELIHNPIGLRFKRYMDIMIALVLGIIAFPLIIGTAIAVLASSGRPIFYSQIRTGENGRDFNVIKFRTMATDAEAEGAQFAEKDDPRVTRFGSFMRKFRFDELPQLWNVLKGEMSFIGPRPERPEFIRDLEKAVPYYNLRHIVKPGITGWAQVMYGYGDSSEDALEKLQYDLFYIKNYSLFLDISIMVRSMKVVLFGTGR